MIDLVDHLVDRLVESTSEEKEAALQLSYIKQGVLSLFYSIGVNPTPDATTDDLAAVLLGIKDKLYELGIGRP